MNHTVRVYPLEENPIPLWNEKQENDEWKKCAKHIDEADSFVLVVPEWNGMAPPGLKNIFLSAEDEFAHKPCLLVGVTAGLSGAYPLIEMRAGSFKNSRVCYIPEQVIIKNAMKFLKEDKPEDDIDKNIRERIVYALRILSEYAKALHQVRKAVLWTTMHSHRGCRMLRVGCITAS